MLKIWCRTPIEVIRERILSEMMRMDGLKGQSYRPKGGDTDQKQELHPGRPPESEANRPGKEPEWVYVLLQKTPLKPFLNPPSLVIFLSLTEPPLSLISPRPHPTPQHSPEAARNRPDWTEKDWNGPKWIELDILQAIEVGEGGGLYMGKAGTIWQFFRALLPSS